VIVSALYSSLTLGSNDVSNAVSALVTLNLMPARLAGLWGGAFMALGVLTWGRGLLQRIGRDIVRLDVPLAATAQASQAISITAINILGHNASINQTIVSGLTGAGLAAAPERVDWSVLRRIVLNWVLSPILGVLSAALTDVVLHAIFQR
jgi:phosphate/sulfate permease